MKQTVVPNRNAIFASILYGYALSIATKNDESVKIGLGVHSGDHEIYPDCRPEFYEALENAFQVGNWDNEKYPFTTISRRRQRNYFERCRNINRKIKSLGDIMLLTLLFQLQS